MSLLLPKQTSRRSVTRRRRVISEAKPAATPRTLTPTIPLILQDRPSVRSGQIFQALLGIAACLALTGVIAQSQSPRTSNSSVDGPAPAVFVHVD